MGPLADDRRKIEPGVLELLEQRHGIGLRGDTCPAWMQERLERALGLLQTRDRPAEGLVEWLKRQPSALAEIAELLRVGETGFYRDGAQWEALCQAVLPRFRDRTRVRALSVGCATGEEAWTLAMLLDRARRAGAGSEYRVVGVDRSALALETARIGVYPPDATRRLPRELIDRYLMRDLGALRIAQSLRRAVSFVLRDAMLGPPPGSYEIILCRNLLIYFGDDAGRKVIELLVRALADGGVLMVARSEVARVRALGPVAEELTPDVTVFRS